jgi:two-component system, chemotaxis family, response regulator WspF
MRIGIVNDLLLAREALRRAVVSVPGYSVAWIVDDGAAAVRQASLDRPDVILMDLVMPGMDGVEATRRIMAETPCPILLVTASVAGNFPMVLQAMGHGGLDSVPVPTLLPDGRLGDATELLSRLARLDRASSAWNYSAPRKSPAAPGGEGTSPLLVLGASTGGPDALGRVLAALPAGFPWPVVVIQHISAEFAPNLVLWLQSRCRLPVETAHEGDAPAAGKVSVAMTDDHLVLRAGGRFAYTPEPARYPFRPSVDEFFLSLPAHCPRPGVAVLLTGMRNDGARGLLALRRAGWLTLAQDPASCIASGMPKAAADLDAADRILPLEQIAGAILARVGCGAA